MNYFRLFINFLQFLFPLLFIISFTLLLNKSIWVKNGVKDYNFCLVSMLSIIYN